MLTLKDAWCKHLYQLIIIVTLQITNPNDMLRFKIEVMKLMKTKQLADYLIKHKKERTTTLALTTPLRSQTMKAHPPKDPNHNGSCFRTPPMAPLNCNTLIKTLLSKL